MAQMKFSFASIVVLLLLIFFGEFQPIEARYKKLEKRIVITSKSPSLIRKELSTSLIEQHVTNTNLHFYKHDSISEVYSPPNGITVPPPPPPPPPPPTPADDSVDPIPSPPPSSRIVDGFRPTAPGHSPGVGHSFSKKLARDP